MLTGAACSGKTTLIDQLADKGFQTVPEIGRQYLEREMARGRTIDEIRENEAAFTRDLIDMQLRIEGGLRAIDVAFLDRAFPDALAFCRVAGLNPNEYLAGCFHHRYASVFVLDQLPIQRDGLRSKDEGLAAFIGIVGGLLVVVSIVFMDRRFQLDDPVGAISVHGVVGMWGLLAVPLSNAEASFGAQLIGLGTIFAWVFGASFIVWLIIKLVMGIRVSEEDEYNGVDLAECGLEAYPEFVGSMGSGK